MTRHRLDLMSLLFGLLLVGATVIAAVAQWTATPMRLDVIIPLGMITLGAVILTAALSHRER
jgi:hypothetical protein